MFFEMVKNIHTLGFFGYFMACSILRNSAAAFRVLTVETFSTSARAMIHWFEIIVIENDSLTATISFKLCSERLTASRRFFSLDSMIHIWIMFGDAQTEGDWHAQSLTRSTSLQI